MNKEWVPVERAQHVPAQARDSARTTFLPGRNCWRAAQASKATVLVDAARYYAVLEGAMRRAEQSILIVGWDFDGRIRLCPDNDDCPSLGEFLRTLVDTKPHLSIDILVWSLAVIHAPGAPLPLLIGDSWQDHPRIRLRLDRRHPLYAAHHQKIVCIDDSIAFCGGIDLTVNRWDTCEHQEANGHRLDPSGTSYSPVHDLQMVVAGDAARNLSELARVRWRSAVGFAPAGATASRDLWPNDLVADFVEAPTAIARTAPAWGEQAIEEIAALTIDMMSAARQFIYIETQYFTSRLVRSWLEKSLLARRGPEIVIVAKHTLQGTLEKYVMGNNRDRLVRRLRRSDRHNRLRAFYPVVPGRSRACEVSVHAKVLVIDDVAIRIGSSNLNNRSMGLDSECDLAIEAADTEMRKAVGRIRNGLLAEHLSVRPAAVAEAIARDGSLIRAIDRLNRNTRGLRPFPETRPDGPTRSVLGTWLLDPQRPIEPLWLRRRKSRRPY